MVRDRSNGFLCPPAPVIRASWRYLQLRRTAVWRVACGAAVAGSTSTCVHCTPVRCCRLPLLASTTVTITERILPEKKKNNLQIRDNVSRSRAGATGGLFLFDVFVLVVQSLNLCLFRFRSRYVKI